jgi:hypothetical protein
MEYTQKNFVYLKTHSKNVAFQMGNKPFVSYLIIFQTGILSFQMTLHERFQLLERGYILNYIADNKEIESDRSVKLNI